MIVELGGGRQIVIDAEGPRSVHCGREDPADRVGEGAGTWSGRGSQEEPLLQGLRRPPPRGSEGPGQGCPAKDYQRQFPATPDFVVLLSARRSPCWGWRFAGIPTYWNPPSPRGGDCDPDNTVVFAAGGRDWLAAAGSATNADRFFDCRLLVETPVDDEAVGHHGDSVESTPCRVQRTHRGWQGSGSTHGNASGIGGSTPENRQSWRNSPRRCGGYPRPRQVEPRSAASMTLPAGPLAAALDPHEQPVPASEPCRRDWPAMHRQP